MLYKALAKINIGLRILSKREDGFHNLESIFYPVNLFDEINVDIFNSRENKNSVYISSDNPLIPLDRNNICYKIIINFFRIFNIRKTYIIKINIKKNIPIGGGLGGGSSDAAAVLKYLINFFNVDINKSRQDILRVASETGSDVPFFLVSKPCLARGKGEILSLLPDFKLNYNILVVNSGVHISTKWAYESLKFPDDIVKEPIYSDLKIFNESDINLYTNDFESIAFKKYGELSEIKNDFYYHGAFYSSMTGSGASIYGFFKDAADMRKAGDYFRGKNYKVFQV